MNLSAWDKFRKQQASEREQLQRLLSGIHGLIAKCHATEPTEIELTALAASLHSFYTGVESIFKRVAVELDGEAVRGDSWHRELLSPDEVANRTSAGVAIGRTSRHVQ